jgi:hypothetical protein
LGGDASFSCACGELVFRVTLFQEHFFMIKAVVAT